MYHRLRDAAVLAGIKVRIQRVPDEHGEAFVALPLAEVPPRWGIGG